MVAPTHTAAAQAAVYSSCTISAVRPPAPRAPAGARSAGRPPRLVLWPYGQYNYTGGTFQNREGQLPTGATYNEYDVYSRARGASRDAYRIVVNRSTKVTYFTPDHYVTFYKL